MVDWWIPDTIGEKLFTKELEDNDLDSEFRWPSEHLGELPDLDGDHKSNIIVKDEEGTLWNFKCSKETTRNHPEVVLIGWVPFLKSIKNLGACDEVTFYRSLDPRAWFEIRVETVRMLFG